MQSHGREHEGDIKAGGGAPDGLRRGSDFLAPGSAPAVVAASPAAAIADMPAAQCTRTVRRPARRLYPPDRSPAGSGQFHSGGRADESNKLAELASRADPFGPTGRHAATLAPANADHGERHFRNAFALWRLSGTLLRIRAGGRLHRPYRWDGLAWSGRDGPWRSGSRGRVHREIQVTCFLSTLPTADVRAGLCRRVACRAARFRLRLAEGDRGADLTSTGAAGQLG